MSKNYKLDETTKKRSEIAKVVKHPMQPVYEDEHGTHRFKPNAIVDFLLDNGGYDMNDLVMLDVSEEDRTQFAQLIGYSVSGFGELAYVSDADYRKADRRSQKLIKAPHEKD